MVVLITGASGFIGQHLLSKLQYQSAFPIHGLYVQYNNNPIVAIGESYVPVKLDLTNHYGVAHFMEKMKPDIIFHLAAKANPRMDDNNPSSIIDNNIKATHNICHFAPKGCRIIHSSSITVYGDQQNSTERHNVCPTSIYGITKVACENIIDYYTRLGHINGVSMRFCATIGSGMTHGMVCDFTKKLMNDELKELTIFGDEPGSIKPYLHIDDACNALIRVVFPYHLNKYYNNSINVCPHDLLSAKDVANILMKILKIKKPIKWLGEKVNNPGDNKVLSACSDFYKTFIGNIRTSKDTIADFANTLKSKDSVDYSHEDWYGKWK